MDTVIAILTFAAGLGLIFISLISAFRTVVLPRAAFDPLTRIIFLGLRSLLLSISLRSGRRLDVETVLAVHAPLSLLTLALAWAIGVMLGFTLLFSATSDMNIGRAFVLAGSSFTTLGFMDPGVFIHEILAIIAAILGLAIVALLIAYLPTIYGLFSKREVVVADIALKSGGEAHGPSLVEQLTRDGDISRLDEMWVDWEHWFIELGETHTSEPSLNFFRSPRADRSWLTAAIAVLDASVMRNVVVDAKYSARAAMTCQAGVEAMVGIAHFFFVRPDGTESDDCLIHRADFEAALDRLDEAGVPIKDDRNKAWEKFAELRSSYAQQFVGLDRLLMPPPTPWLPQSTDASSDTPSAG